MQKESSFGVPAPERRAMNISLVVGVMMLAVKWTAYILTGSAAVFSDAIETIVHIAAVGFASYSVRLTYRPPDYNHHFGHEKISYLSAGMEGGLIILAAIVIIYQATDKILYGIELEKVGIGTALTLFTGGVNTILGVYLLRRGKQRGSIIIEANGKHILTDAWTSAGAIVGLVAAKLSGYMIIDPIVALIFGGNIIFEGVKLMRNSVYGLMDGVNPLHEQLIAQTLTVYCETHGITYHRLRLRESAGKIYVDFHLQFPDGTPIEKAHAIATAAEESVAKSVSVKSDVISHLESSHHPPGHI
ncbi:MAG: cation diffusion facilitator family transporter [Bacteroidetes bacterium]|nr:cation transporter [Bacteroidota bacterium]MCZ2131672.1 cation diffusion facilitator family transporter [Bacteroidota bacterium]